MGFSEKFSELREKFENKIHKNKSATAKKPADDASVNKSLSLSNVDCITPPPDFDDIKNSPTLKNNKGDKNEPSKYIFETIKESLSDSDSLELEFPDRTENNEEKDSKAVTQVIARDNSKLLEKRRYDEVLKMKQSDTNLVNEGSKRFSGQSFIDSYEPNIAESYEKYIEKYKDSKYLKRPNQYSIGSTKQVKLYLESVDTVFDQDGNRLTQFCSIKNLGTSEFIPAKQALFQQSSIDQPANSLQMLDPADEVVIISEIEKFEKGKSKPGKYFFNGKQIYPVVNFNETTTKYSYENDSKIANEKVDKSEIGIKKTNDEIARMIVQDLLTEYGSSQKK